jgi:tetratricopeptide (TPR) repeat protein
VRNSTEAIKLLTDARAYYLLNGPPSHAAICLYQKSIAHYIRRDYSRAERDLIQAHEDFKNLKDYGQMGYCVYHRAVLNARRGFVLKALGLFEDSRRMFEEMDNPRMVAFSFLGKARMSSALCRVGDAEEACTQALVRLEKLGAVTRFQLQLQNISYACNLALTFGWYVVEVVTVFCCELFLQWTRMGRGWQLR